MPQLRMTKTDIIAAVREITEISAADASDTVMEIYMRDGYNRIIELERRWTFLETSFNMTTTDGVREYTPDNFTNDEIREIVSIVDDEDNKLDYVGYDDLERFYLNSGLTVGRPLFYTFWENQVLFFPEPNDEYVLKIRAYRYPFDWVTYDIQPDGVASFDMALVYYVVSRIYQAQEELNTAATYERMYADTVTLARRDLTRPPSSSPVKFAGGSKWRGFRGTDWGY